MLTWYEHAGVWLTAGGYGRVSLSDNKKGQTRTVWESKIWVCNKWARVGLHPNATTAKRCIERCLKIRNMEVE